LKKKFKSTIAVYKEGDSCPNFRYTLFACEPEKSTSPIHALNENSNENANSHVNDNSNGNAFENDGNAFKNDGNAFENAGNSNVNANAYLNYLNEYNGGGHYKTCEKYNSGVVDIRNFKDKEKCIVKDIRVTTTTPIPTYVSELYKYSIWPTMIGVKKLITSMLHDPTLKTIDDVLYNIKDFFIISQSELCTMHKGVYYNFICRGGSKRRPSIKKQQLHTKIHEAELYRKGQHRRVYEGPDYIYKKRGEYTRQKKNRNYYNDHLRANAYREIETLTRKKQEHRAQHKRYDNVQHNRLTRYAQEAIAIYDKRIANQNNPRYTIKSPTKPGNYIKINDKWVHRTPSLENMNHISPKKPSPRKSKTHTRKKRIHKI
jgi:hypothetical protein